MENTASDEVQAILKHASKEFSKHGYVFISFAVRVPFDGSPPVFAYNVSGGNRVVADVFREAADFLDRVSDAGAAVCPHAEVVN